MSDKVWSTSTLPSSPPPSSPPRHVIASFLFTGLGNKGRSELVGWRRRSVSREIPSTTRAHAYLISCPKTANRSLKNIVIWGVPPPSWHPTFHRRRAGFNVVISTASLEGFPLPLPLHITPHTHSLGGAFPIVKTACDCHASPRVSRRADYCPPPPWLPPPSIVSEMRHPP